VKKVAAQPDGATSPGTLLRLARESQGMTQREAADRLHFMPGYVAILERDDYRALRSPSFARSYIKAYGRLLGLDVQSLLAAYDRLVEATPARPPQRAEGRPLQLQRTGIGVVTGLAVLTLLVAVLWWWEEGRSAPEAPELSREAQARSDASLQFAGGNQ
jgi:cytoskeletal protein RodZ